MSNLLDISSLVLTPTAYNNGEALCIKPDDASGDFQFSRNSAATRVNAQGLVENVQILSSNLVQNGDFSEEGVQEVSNGSFSQEGVEQITNGDFSNGSTGWDLRGVTTVYDDKANTISTSSQYILLQNSVTTIGKQYKITYDLVVDSGTLVTYYDTVNLSSRYRTTSGTYTEYFEAVALNMAFRSVGNFTGSIDNISVREVAQNWVLTSGASIGENKLDINANAYDYFARQLDVSTIGKTYKVSVDAEIQSGRMILYLADTNAFEVIDTSGSYTFYIVADGTQIRFRAFDTALVGSITNISVKEVGQNWTLGTGWEIGDSVAISDTTASNLTPSTTLISGEKYKFTLDVAKISAGSFTFLLRFNGTNTTFATINTEGSFTFYATADATGFRLQNLSGGTTDFSVTNITAVQISSDTNLPRINYEGFSYQDALGSELVVNGTFDSNIDFWNKGGGNVNPLSWNNGKIKITNDVAQLNSARQTIVTEIGKTYKVSADVDSTNGITPRLASSNPTTAVIGTLGTIETLTYTFTATSTSSQIELFNWQNTINKYNLWDNVSVKEYLGQEVVPDSGCGSWLFEPQSTNLVTYSEDFSNASWQKQQSGVATIPTVTSNFSISPDGTQNADRVVFNLNGGTTSNDFSQITYSSPIYTGDATNYVYIKSNTNDSYVMSVCTPTGSARQKTITPNWQRFDVTSLGASQALTVRVRLRGGSESTSSFADVSMWGAQIEALSYPTSYIPTEGSQVTRNEDLCNNGGSLASINSTEGTLYFEGSTLVDATTQRWISLGSGGNANRVSILFNAPSRISCSVRASSSAVYDANFNIGSQTNHTKAAIRYKNNDYSFFVNGVKVNSQLNGTLSFNSPLSELAFDSADGGSKFFGKTKALAVFPYLSDAELTELTTI